MKIVYFSFPLSDIKIRTLKHMSKPAKLNENNLFEMEFSEVKTENSELPTYLFEEIESELTSITIYESSPEGETDGAFEVIKNFVDNIRSEIENL